jgi:hypothetical protein
MSIKYLDNNEIEKTKASSHNTPKEYPLWHIWWEKLTHIEAPKRRIKHFQKINNTKP